MKDKVPNVPFPIILICFQSLKRGQPLYKGQNGWFQRVLYSEVNNNNNCSPQPTCTCTHNTTA